jgi:hypothetical protein
MTMNAPKFSVQVLRQYVPALQTRIPSYGLGNSADGMNIIIAISDKAPVEILELLEAELKAKLYGFVPPSPHAAVQYAERLTHDFLHAHVVAGNLRYDRVTSGWRWVGPREPSR